MDGDDACKLPNRASLTGLHAETQKKSLFLGPLELVHKLWSVQSLRIQKRGLVRKVLTGRSRVQR
jgi:hypothetical protein